MDCSAERLGWAPAVRRDYIPLAGVAHRGNPVGVGYPGHEVHPGLVQQRLDQPRFQGQASGASRTFDRGPQLNRAHRAGHDLPVLQGRQELRVGGAAVVQVGPHFQHHQRGRLTTPVSYARNRAQGADEDLAVPILGAPQEGLLELVHPPGPPGPRWCHLHQPKPSGRAGPWR
jgi:hypothetical protein